VENEYGSYNACDQKYMLWLRDLYKSFIKSKALLYTTDMCDDSSFKCGSVDDVYATVDFGSLNTDCKYFNFLLHTNIMITIFRSLFILTWLLVNQCFQLMKEIQNGGPLVNSEYYGGWASYWGSPLVVISSDTYLSTMKDLLALNASVNIFMFQGGTNFGFTSGAIKKSNQNYSSSITSYDFSAPLNEAGDPTDKYFEIKKLLKETVSFNDINLYM